ncbi:hypothetical protein [Bdellovibrio sp. HCB337]|uniref:hypothetical protein n=1 Tax=Bdellovibrio sp. HCB337 TaxID=3394358 RepID=UPI0039A5A277
MAFWTKCLLILAIQVTTCFTWSAAAPLSKNFAASFNKENILIDSRRPIAGNGDTASTFFLIQNLIELGFKGTVNILVDEKSERILRTISSNLQGLESQVRLIREAELPAKEYSVVIRTGMPSGRILADGLHLTTAESPAQAGKLNINDKTVFLSTPIYGNTKNTASIQPLSLLNQGNKFYLLPAPGLDANSNEAGIFRDPFSLSIRNWSLDKAEKFLLEQTKTTQPDLHSLLNAVIQDRKSGNTRYALAYGFSIPQVKVQARDYFRSLLNSSSPLIVLTPSAFSESLLASFSEEERSKISLTNLKEFSESGNKLPPGHLTVVQVPNVPHQIFSTLLLASNRNHVVPLGAGDGFFTTALSLGIPFAPTTVDWNIRNVRALGGVLQNEGVKQGFDLARLQSLRSVYSIDPGIPVQLQQSQKLMMYDNLFKNAHNRIPDFSELFVLSVGYLRQTNTPPPGLKVLENIQHAYIGTPSQDIISCERVF